MILNYFLENKIEIPLIITFHKYDPEIRSNEIILNDVETLRSSINNIYPTFKILYQMTSIFDIISIVQLMDSLCLMKDFLNFPNYWSII